MESFLRKHYKTINIRVILIIGVIGFYLANVQSQLLYENTIYYLSKSDLMYLIGSNKGFYMTSLYAFVPIAYYIFFWKDKNDFEKIRYKSRGSEYKDEILEMVKFTVVYIGIIYFYLIISSLIKGSGEQGITQLIKDVYLNTITHEGTLNLALYNMNMIILLSGIIFVLFYFLVGNTLCFSNMMFKNKFITLIIGVIIINIIVYYTTFGGGESVVEYLFINHLDINCNGFSIFDNRYLNMGMSIGYLSVLNVVVYLFGKLYARKKEVFNYNKGGIIRWNLG